MTRGAIRSKPLGMGTRPLEVHKFGGTSVADAARLVANADTLAREAARARLVVVSSATAGTTDALVAALELAALGQGQEAASRIHALATRHRAILAELGGDDEVAIESLLEELEGLVGATAVTRDPAPRLRDRVLATGEKLAVRLFALALRTKGLDAVPVFADVFLETDSRFGAASALGGVADRRTQAYLHPLVREGRIPVVTGFCGRAPDGATTTLGRGGSDLSATLVAAALDADAVTIWTDVDGVFSADPRVVPGARVIRQLNYREAAEMSHYGAKVLHQRTMIPAQAKRIPVRTRNSLRPDAPGTVVDGRFTPGSHPVKAVSAIRGQALLSIEGKGMAGVPGISARVFGALADREISATMISQASSESSICLAVTRTEAELAAAVLKETFRAELSRGAVEEIGVIRHVGLVAVVGLGMAQTRGVAARTMQACAEAQVNLLAIAQGSSELNITLAVEEADVDRAVRALHDGFELHRADPGVDAADGLDLVIFGLGQIGRRLVSIAQARAEHIRTRFGVAPRVVCAIDRSGFVVQPRGLTLEALDTLADAKAGGGRLADQPGGRAGLPEEALDAVLEYRLARPILVDTSDADHAEGLFARALERGCDVVTANKKPLGGAFSTYAALVGASAKHGRMLKAEATVGAGLPVVDTLEMLTATGDRVRMVQGCLSGTLGFLTARLEAGEPFSEAVAEARDRGYSEPDPVADLTGADVARKATILGRWSGLLGEGDEVELEGFVDPSWARQPWPALQEKLRTLDETIAARIAAARASGGVLRYVARVEPGRAVVRPEVVPADSPMGRLSGAENLVMFVTDRYDEIPLVITGPGAGVSVTAMGVLGDVLRVAAERRRS